MIIKNRWIHSLSVVALVAFALNKAVNADVIIEVDNEDATYTGAAWPFAAGVATTYGQNYQYQAGSGVAGATATARFINPVSFDVTGIWCAYGRWTALSNRPTNVTYQVYDGGSLRFSTVVDQTRDGSKWVRLGCTTFTSGSVGEIRILNSNYPPTRYAIADAVRWVRENVDSGETVDEPGIDWNSQGSRNIATQVTDNCSAMTNLTQVTISRPNGGAGYVFLTTGGIAALTTVDRWVRVCISNVSGGSSATCNSWAPIMEEDNANAYENERRYAINNVYTYSSGTPTSDTYYLKACKEPGATGTIFWNDLVALYFRSRY